jgi:type IV pilus assembly protein PilC
VVRTYNFVGIDRRGARRRGRVVATDPEAAREKLLRRGVQVKRLRRRFIWDLFSQDFDMLRPKLPLKDVLWIHRNLASLVSSGLRIPIACELMSDQRPGKRVSRVLTQIRTDLESGMGVGEAFAQQESQLGRVPTSMVQAGDLAGALVPAFKGVITLCEAQIRLRKNLRRAISYPLAVLFTTSAVFLCMVYFVVPSFIDLYSELNAPLPGLTQGVINVSITMTRQVWVFPASVFLIFLLVILVRQLPSGRAVFDHLLLKIPRLGQLIHRSITTRSAATLSALLTARVPICDALEMTAKASGNSQFEDAFLDIEDSIAQGESVTDSFASVDQIPLILRDLAAVGDASGNLEGVLYQYAVDTEEDLKRDGENFGKTIEPFLVIFLGVVVGVMVISLYLPVFQLVTIVG